MCCGTKCHCRFLLVTITVENPANSNAHLTRRSKALTLSDTVTFASVAAKETTPQVLSSDPAISTVSCVGLSIVYTVEAPIATAVLSATGGGHLLAKVCALRLLRVVFLVTGLALIILASVRASTSLAG